MICQKAGIYPTDPYHVYLGESMVNAIDDIISEIYSPYLPHNAEKKDEMIETLKNTKLPKNLTILNKRLSENEAGKGKYLVGSKLSFADVKVAGVYVAQLLIAHQSDFDEYLNDWPEVKAYFEHLKNVEFKAHFDKQPQRML